MNLNRVADHFEVSRPAISKHIKILAECGLVTIRQQGRERYCSAKPEKLAEVGDWLEPYRRFWTAKLDALDTFLAAGETPLPPVKTTDRSRKEKTKPKTDRI